MSKFRLLRYESNQLSHNRESILRYPSPKGNDRGVPSSCAITPHYSTCSPAQDDVYIKKRYDWRLCQVEGLVVVCRPSLQTAREGGWLQQTDISAYLNRFRSITGLRWSQGSWVNCRRSSKYHFNSDMTDRTHDFELWTQSAPGTYFI